MADKKKRGVKIGTKYHDDFTKAAAMIFLGTVGNNYELTAQQFGVTPETIHNWEKVSLAKKEALPELIESTLRKLIEMMPKEWTGNTWAIAFGILMDKWLLVHNMPTERKESLFADLTEQLEPNTRENVINYAEDIIKDAMERRGREQTDSRLSASEKSKEE